MKKFLVAGVAVGALMISAPGMAADVPMRAPAYKAPPVVAPASWQGCYIGLHGGYGWADAEDKTATPSPRNLNPDGYFAGGQIGCNWQWHPQWVVGVEGDIAGSNISETKTFSGGATPTIEEKIKWIASARVRAGFLSTPNNLLYVTGGWGWADTSRHTRLGGGASQTRGADVDGWVLGAGWEHLINQNWTVKLEYLYYDLGDGTYNFNIGTGPNKVDLNLQTVKFGVNFKY